MIFNYIGVYIGISIITNLLTLFFYVMSIGSGMGLELLDEIGNIKNKKTEKLLNYNISNIKFIYDLSNEYQNYQFFRW